MRELLQINKVNRDNLSQINYGILKQIRIITKKRIVYQYCDKMRKMSIALKETVWRKKWKDIV